MKISIIVPIYNVENYITECLDSVTTQTFPGEIECILIDDCGSDNSMSLVCSYIESYHGRIQFTILHHEHNRGLSAARNTGMEASSGDYIFFLDSDDMIKPECIATFYAFIQEKGDSDFVISGIGTLGGKEVDKPKISPDLPNVIVDDEILKTFVNFDWFVLAQSKFYKKSFLVESNIHFYEGLIHEDNLWTYNIVTAAKRMGIIKTENYIYRIHEGSIMTSTKAQRRVDSLLTIINEVVKDINNDGGCKAEKYDYVRTLSNTIASCAVGLPTSDYYEAYRRLRDVVKVNLYNLFSVYGSTFKKILLDFHYTIPISLGFRMYKFMHKK